MKNAFNPSWLSFLLKRLCLVSTLCAAHCTLAQYIAIDVTPPISTNGLDTAAKGYANSGGIQVGTIGFGSGGIANIFDMSVPWFLMQHAALWSSSLGSVVDLTPSPTEFSEAYGTDGSQEVGQLYVPPGSFNSRHAALWTGTAASFVDLNPPAYADSVAYGCSRGQQVGFGVTPTTVLQDDSRFTIIQGGSHALMWSGTAASVVDLNPQGYLASISFGIENGVEVGSGVSSDGVTRALRWTGTPESYVELSPVSDFAGNPSVAFGIQGGQVVGYYDSFGARHAAIWNGPTAADMLDVHPPQYYHSVIRATTGAIQVGSASVGTGLVFGGDLHPHAMRWSGTADSALDLHQFLPPGWNDSIARGIGADGTIIVTAMSHYLGDSIVHTFLLVPSAPAPCAVASVSVDQSVVTLDNSTGTPLLSSPVMGIVTLTSPAPPGGAVVTLLNPDFSGRQTSVTVPEGAIGAPFLASDPLLVYPADYNWSQNINATYGGVTKSAHYVTLGAFPIFQGPVRQGLVGRIELATPVDADEMVTLASDHTNVVQVPNKILLKAGMALAEYPLTITPATTDTLVGVSGLCSRGGFAGQMLVHGVPPPPPASLTTISPASVVAGTFFTMTLTGQNFVAGAQVLINGVALPTSVFSPTSMTVDIPGSVIDAPAAAQVEVLNPGSTASSPITLTITGDLPVLDSVTPAIISAGSPTYTMSLSGSSFYSTSVANWQVSGGTKTPLLTKYVSSTTLTAEVPASLVAAAGKAQVFVETPADGTSATAFSVTITPPISLSSISPNTVLAATPFTMTLKGANFLDGAQVNVAGTLVPATLSSSSQMTALVPGSAIPLAGSVSVFAMNPDGTASGALPLNLQNPVPQITGLSPASVSVNSPTFTLTINGTNFVTTSQVRWNGSAIATTYVSATQLQATIPATNLVKTGKFKIDVQNPNPGGGGSNGVNLTVE